MSFVTVEERLEPVNIKAVQAMVHQASRVISHYWPMTLFTYRNPLSALETIPFHKAVAMARRFTGGRGYLPNAMYRQLMASGRILPQQVDAALESYATAHAQTKDVTLGGRHIRQVEVMRAHLLEGITAPSLETMPSFIARIPDSEAVRALAGRLTFNFSVKQHDDMGVLGHSMTLATWCDRTMTSSIVWQIDREVIKWCQAFLDEGHAAWSMPERESGFYAAWRSLAAQEWSPCGIRGCNQKIKALPESPEAALMAHLDAMGIPAELRQDYLSLQLGALFGWASFIKWRAERTQYPWQVAYPIDLVQYLAVRLFYERELVDQACRDQLGIDGSYSAISLYGQTKADKASQAIENAQLAAAWRLIRLANVLELPLTSLHVASETQLQSLLAWLDDFPESEHGVVWLDAYEAGYHDDLMATLQTTLPAVITEAPPKTRPEAQVMFCIDVRSEPYRRHLEAIGQYERYETFGFAGFFGFPIRCQALDQHHLTDQCPVIVDPQFTVHEVVREGQNELLARHDARRTWVHMIHEIIHDLKHHVLTPYIMVEALGWFFGVLMLERTLFPGTYRKERERFQRALVPPVVTQLTVDKDAADRGLTTDEQNTSMETILRTMGLTQNFARLVVVAGHTSMSDNNPYEAALNCGACGGNSGESNARLFAAIANKPQVRQYLASKGIVIPDDTYFIGAVHNTTTDAMELYDLIDLPDSHREDVARLQADFATVALHNNRERCTRLPGVAPNLSLKRAAQEVNRRAGDWSEILPEWGLSGNACFIIGRRSLTRDLNLEGRSFLNSHDYRLDPTGELLEGILMGPMVVGQWINAEYYFSTTDPDIYGSGSKVYHNVVGRMAIMSGPYSDLRTGLAVQSVMTGDRTYHEPLRLCVVIEAPRQRILDILERQPLLKQLCDNEWIHLVAIDHESDKKLYRYRFGYGWTDV